MKVTIIGTGNMARGIGTRVRAGGNDVELIGRDQEKAKALADEIGGSVGDSPTGEAVVLAVPYGAVGDVVSAHGSALQGKVVVDITNPVDWGTFQLITPGDGSAGEEIAKLVPGGTPVVKAFNTIFAGTLVAGEVAGQKLDVLLAGDDADAKATVASFSDAGGLRALDVGPLSRARQLENLAYLHMGAQEPLGSGFGSAIKLVW